MKIYMPLFSKKVAQNGVCEAKPMVSKVSAAFFA